MNPDEVQAWRNHAVDVALLPAVDDAPFESLEPRYLLQQRVIWSAISLTMLTAAVTSLVLFDAPAMAWLPAIGLPLALFGVAWVLEGLAFAHRGVQLRELDVSTRRGVISRSTVTVPFVRVQHVTVERGLLDRSFGLASVVIFTAGAHAADAKVQGLSPDRAERLREGIVNRSNREIGAS